MSPHPESNELSAYLDGELSESERARIEGHLATCAECTSTLEDVRTAMIAMKALPPAEMSREQIQALDAALDKASREPPIPARARARRWMAAAVAVAAVAAAVAVVPRITRHAPTRATVTFGANEEAGTAAYDKRSAYAALLAFAAAGDQRTVTNAPKTAALPTPQAGAPAFTTQSSTAGTSNAGGVAPCDAAIRASGGDVVLDHAFAGTFDGRQAWLLFYLAPASKPTRAELWVVQASDCFTLYFAQAQLR
jgi:hypothetical protein